jgi:urease accessory protein
MTRLRTFFAFCLLVAATPAFAHPGHDSGGGFLAGLIHPLTGVDHLAAMVMIGLWGGIAFARRWWACPAAFLAFMAAGFGLGVTGAELPFAEPLILASLVLLAAALALNLRPPLRLALPFVALFGAAHGFAHGGEVPPGSIAGSFAAGFLLMTALLHGAGLLLARLVTRSGRLDPDPPRLKRKRV